MTQDTYIKALLRERDGYLSIGRADRAAEVDAELARNGYKPEPAVERATKRAPRKAK
jgi:hypothetical protein